MKPTSLTLRNGSTELASVYVEPYPSDYWLRPGESLQLIGNPGDAEIDIAHYADGFTVLFGADFEPAAYSSEGVRLPNGYQRPDDTL